MIAYSKQFNSVTTICPSPLFTVGNTTKGNKALVSVGWILGTAENTVVMENCCDVCPKLSFFAFPGTSSKSVQSFTNCINATNSSVGPFGHMRDAML